MKNEDAPLEEDESLNEDLSSKDEASQGFLTHVMFTGLAEIAGLAANWGIPYKLRRKLFDLASYHNLERAGMKSADIMQVLDVSARTVSSLAKAMKRFDFLGAPEHCDLLRRITLMLWAKPMSEGRICQHLAPESPDDVLRAIETLIKQGCVGRETHPISGVSTYKLLKAHFRMEDDGWFTRIDAVGRFFQSVTRVLNARFMKKDPRAMAGSIMFRVPENGFDRLHKFYIEQLWPLLNELEEEALRDPEHATEADLSIFWSPSYDDGSAEGHVDD